MQKQNVLILVENRLLKLEDLKLAHISSTEIRHWSDPERVSEDRGRGRRSHARGRKDRGGQGDEALCAARHGAAPAHNGVCGRDH